MRIGRIVLIVVAGVAALGGAVYAAFVFSPWPAVLLIRHTFEKDAVARNRALEKHLPSGVSESLDVRYGADETSLLDVFAPAAAAADGKPVPAVVWIHGGAFVAGNKRDLTNYLKILAARGYATVAVGYAIAPEGRYPAPARQASEALAYLLANAQRLRIDPDRIVLAGDSAGSQIAAQVAAVISDPAYARAVGIAPTTPRRVLRGVVLFCGVYDATAINLDGDFGGFIRTVMWSYFGEKNFSSDPRVAQMSVNRHVTGDFPPAFVSVGNADPLAPQSVLVAEGLRAKNVATETLFFPTDYKPPLAHEYQFNLDTEAGKQAFERFTEFLRRVTN